MLEADLKAIKCLRHSANKPVWDYSIADSVLKGLLKTKEAKSLFHLGLEREMVQGQIDREILWLIQVLCTYHMAFYMAKLVIQYTNHLTIFIIVKKHTS